MLVFFMIKLFVKFVFLYKYVYVLKNFRLGWRMIKVNFEKKNWNLLIDFEYRVKNFWWGNFLI